VFLVVFLKYPSRLSNSASSCSRHDFTGPRAAWWAIMRALLRSRSVFSNFSIRARLCGVIKVSHWGCVLLSFVSVVGCWRNSRSKPVS
jgi:hypothetical protein